MQTAFRALLSNDSGVTALVPAARIEWGVLRQGSVLPAISLHLIDNTAGMTLTGSDGFWRGRVQVDVYAQTYSSAKTIADAITDRLHGYAGAEFQLVALDSQRDFDETAAADRPCRISLDFLTIWSA